MFSVLECVVNHHDRLTVSLAAAIWTVGSLAFFLILSRARECSADRRDGWIAIGGLAGGLGAWATHFVAMLAYQGGVAIEYDLVLTLCSAAIAVGAFWLALRTYGSGSILKCFSSGLLVATGVAVMHFVGMAAIRAAATVRYEFGAVLVGFVIAAALFTGAFLVFGQLTGWRKIVGAASLALVSVCALHFTGMSATTLVPDPSLPAVGGGASQEWLVAAIVASAALLIVVTTIAAVLDRYLTDLKGFAGATLEGLAIVRDQQVVEVNARLAEMMGVTPADLLGQDADVCLVAADGKPLVTPRDQPVEAALRGFDDNRVFQVAVHTIEYRGRDCQVLAVRDLTEAKAAQRQIEHLARHDGLTELPNRALLQERLDHAIARCARSGEALAVIALDLDRFKAVNDIFGHAEGDRVLKTVADILRRCVRGADTVARIGGDEFVILQIGADQPDGAHSLTERILETFRVEMNAALDPTAVGVSIGVALYPDDGVEAAALRHAADIALYRAKMGGRGMAAFFDTQMDLEARARRELESDLRHAIARHQLRLVYQPLVDTIDGRQTGYEALLRWDHPTRGEVSPDVFIPIAEETGAIITIGEWVLREACRSAADWPDALTLAVNVSAVQFQVANLPEVVLAALTDTGLPARRLELELTETAMLKDRDATVRTLHRLKAMGVGVVMDDFGTGYSSLSNLQSFPFDKIKIDRSFIQSMETDEAARSIIRAIVGIGRSLNLPVVAEGVETAAQRQMVEDEGCPQAQGFLFGKPGPMPTFNTLKASDSVAAA